VESDYSAGIRRPDAGGDCEGDFVFKEGVGDIE